jgi:hypothetical protein
LKTLNNVSVNSTLLAYYYFANSKQKYASCQSEMLPVSNTQQV